jgi:hypothetical protein
MPVRGRASVAARFAPKSGPLASPAKSDRPAPTFRYSAGDDRSGWALTGVEASSSPSIPPTTAQSAGRAGHKRNATRKTDTARGHMATQGKVTKNSTIRKTTKECASVHKSANRFPGPRARGSRCVPQMCQSARGMCACSRRCQRAAVTPPGGGPGGQNEPSWGNQKRCAPLRLCESLVEHRSLPRSLRNLVGQNRVRTKPRILEGDAGRHSVPLSGH